MIEFDLGDELGLLVETTRQFAREQLVPALREAEASRQPSERVCSAFAAIGLDALELPERLGGAGLGALARVLVNEELGAGDAGAALALDPLGPALYPVLELGGEAALADLHACVSAQPGARALLVVEPGDRELSAPLLLELPWAPADAVAALVLLGDTTAQLVTEGIRCERVRGSGLRAAGASRIELDRAPVRAAWRDAASAERARARARLHTASLLLGVLRAACEFSRGYALERRAFGKPIAHHQALAFLITDMNLALEAARGLVHEAAWRLDRGLPAGAEAAAAFAECIDAARMIGPNGVQILGGHGFMADYPVEKHMREARALGLLAGGLDLAIEEAGRRLAGSEQPLAIAGLLDAGRDAGAGAA
jgi:acyl-CoA dehydrogenase